MPLGTKVGLGPGHIMLDGDQARSPTQWGTAPDFRLMSVVATGKTAGWIKMSFGTKV